MDYCEGGDLFNKINSQRGVLFSEDQVSHKHFDSDSTYDLENHISNWAYGYWSHSNVSLPSAVFCRSWIGLYRFVWHSNTCMIEKSFTGTSNHRYFSEQQHLRLAKNVLLYWQCVLYNPIRTSSWLKMELCNLETLELQGCWTGTLNVDHLLSHPFIFSNWYFFKYTKRDVAVYTPEIFSVQYCRTCKNMDRNAILPFTWDLRKQTV